MPNNSLDDNLFVTTFSVRSDPAVGNNSTGAVGGGAQSELTLITFTLVTDANAANRVVHIDLVDSGITIPLGSAAIAHTASNTFGYIATQNATTNAAGNIATYTIPLPNLRIFDPTALLNIVVDNIEAGDQLSDIRIYRKVWRGAG